MSHGRSVPRLTLIFTLLLSSWTVWANPAAASGSAAQAKVECEQELAPLVWTPQPTYEVELQRPFGEIAKARDLSHLYDGQYLFLLTADQTLVYAEKFQVGEYKRSGRGLVTHKSLLKRLEKEKERVVAGEIAGSGEFTIRNGHVSKLSNRSGNFRSGEAHFDFSETVLANYGLPIEIKTIREIVDPLQPEDWGHTPESITLDTFNLSLAVSLRESSVRREATAAVRMIFLVLSELYPGNIPGDLDPTKAFRILNEFPAGEQDGLFNILQIISQRNSPHGLDLYLKNFLDEREPKATMAVIYQTLVQLHTTLAARLSPEQAKKFANFEELMRALQRR